MATYVASAVISQLQSTTIQASVSIESGRLHVHLHYKNTANRQVILSHTWPIDSAIMPHTALQRISFLLSFYMLTLDLAERDEKWFILVFMRIDWKCFQFDFWRCELLINYFNIYFIQMISFVGTLNLLSGNMANLGNCKKKKKYRIFIYISICTEARVRAGNIIKILHLRYNSQRWGISRVLSAH